MSNKLETLEELKQKILKHPKKAHPDFDILLSTLEIIENVKYSLLEQKSLTVEQEKLLQTVINTIEEAEKDFNKALLLKENLK